MSRSKGKREAIGDGGWRKGGDPFSENAPQETKESRHSEGGGAHLPWRAWPRWKQALTIGGGCLALLLAIGVGWWFLNVRAPDVSKNNRPGITDNNPNQTTGGEDSDSSTGRKEDYFTFLLIGRDTAGGGNTDTMILVSYDVPNQQINMMSIPRDTAVNVTWRTKKLNSVYNAKESSGGGLEGLKTHVAYLTGVMPDFHVIIEWKAVGEVVDAVDGVEFDVPRNMNYDDDYQNLHIHLNKGLQTLDGQQAMEMLRYRKDNRDSNGVVRGYDDIGRMNTPRDFLKAMAKKVLQLGNITKIGDFIKIFMENVETDLKLSDLMWFATQAMNADLSTMQSSTLPYIDVGHYRGGDYLLPNGEEIVPLINEQFNPYNREITLSDLQILVKNKDGSCTVTSGELLDSQWGKPTASSAGTAGGGVSTTDPTGITADPTPDQPDPPPSGGDDGQPPPSAENTPGSGNESGSGEGAGGENTGNTPPEPDGPDEPQNPEGPGEDADPGLNGGDEPAPPPQEPGDPPPENPSEPTPEPDPEPEPELPPEFPPEEGGGV